MKKTFSEWISYFNKQEIIDKMFEVDKQRKSYYKSAHDLCNENIYELKLPDPGNYWDAYIRG